MMHSLKEIKRIHKRFGKPDSVVLGIDVDAKDFDVKGKAFDTMMQRVMQGVIQREMKRINSINTERIKQWWWMQEVSDWGFTDINIADNPLIKTCRKGNIQFRIVISESGRSIKIIREN